MMRSASYSGHFTPLPIYLMYIGWAPETGLGAMESKLSSPARNKGLIGIKLPTFG